jgi:hypothetical protein
MTRRSWRWVVGVVALCACTSTPKPSSPGRPAKRGNPTAADLRGAPSLPAVVIAEVAAGAEIHFARRGEKGLLVARRRGRWLAGAVRVAGKGAAVSSQDAQRGMREVGAAPTEKTAAMLRSVGDHFALVWSAPAAGGQEIRLLELDPSGAARGEARVLGRSSLAVTWVEVLRAGGAAFALWEVRRGSTSDISVAPLGGARGAKSALEAVHGAGGWHAVAGPRSLAVAWVTPEGQERGKVRVVEISASGSRGRELTLSSSSKALFDVQVAAVGDGYVVAWTEPSANEGDLHLQMARVAAGAGKAEPPTVPLPVGEQALVALVSSEDHARALVAWEEDAGGIQSPRIIQLATLDRSGRLSGDRATLELHGTSAAPHLMADGAGFAALTLAPLAARAEKPPATTPAPTFVRFESTLAVRAAEPVRVAQLAVRGAELPGVPDEVHGLYCEAGVCTAIARGSGDPGLLALVTLPARPSPWRAPARLLDTSERPRTEGLTTVAGAEEAIAEVSAARLHDGRSLVAWLSQNPAKSPTDASATLAYCFVDRAGTAGPVQTLSQRAMVAGGLDVAALAASDRDGGVAVLAWAGPNDGASQIYLSKISGDGKKVGQKTVTKRRKNTPGDVFDVDLVVDGERGMVVAWSDVTQSDASIFVARTNPALERDKPERRVHQGGGMAAEPALALVQGRLLLAWSQTPPQGGQADVMVAALDAATLNPSNAGATLEASAGHSRTPRWGASQRGALALSWVEEKAPTGEGDEAADTGLRLVALEDDGRPATAVRRVSMGKGQLTSAAVGCTAERCRGVLLSVEGGSLELGAFETPRDSGAPVAARAIARLGGVQEHDRSLTALDAELTELVFAHDRNAGRRVRRLALGWEAR